MPCTHNFVWYDNMDDMWVCKACGKRDLFLSSFISAPLTESANELGKNMASALKKMTEMDAAEVLGENSDEPIDALPEELSTRAFPTQ